MFARNEYAMSHEEIARRMGLSRSTVMRLEADAMRKIRQRLKARGITFDDLNHHNDRQHPLAALAEQEGE